MTSTDASRTYPLTSSQREIWFEQVLRKHSSMYNIGGYIRIDGAIDPALFEQAIHLLLLKHDCLRTELIKGQGDDDLPMQAFAAQMPLTVPLHDFSAEADPHASALAWMQSRFNEPFVLFGQPLTRHDLLQLGPDRFYWLLQYHHIIVDGWSIALLCRSLAEIYSKLQSNAAPDLAARSYVEFIEDDRAYVEGETCERQRAYWLEKYRNAPDVLLKPRYGGRDPERVARSECRSLQLPRSFYDQLGALAKAHGATTFHVILAVLYVYFVRTARRDELIVGLPVLNRSNAAYKATAGLFVGVSAVRFDFGTDLGFAELLRSIGRVLKQDYRHQRFPVSELNREVLQRTGREQLFDVRVSYERHDHDTLFGAAPGRATALLNSYHTTPLTLFVREFHDDEAVELDFVYNRAYFQADEIDCMQRCLLGVLDAVLLDDEQPIWRLPLLSEADRHQLLVQWNQTQREYPADRCVHELFEEQVERTPHASALEHEGQQLTYAQLNAKANRLAQYLSKLDVGPASRIALDLERSAALVIAQLAVLKAGSAYVPLDEDAPLARKAWILSDCEARVVLSVRARELPNLPCLQRIDLDDIDLSAHAAYSDNRREIPRRSTDIAYVMYTSGSTGEPKGVQVLHQGISRLVLNNGYADFTATDRVAFAANPAFDASTLEIWAALLNGGCSVIVDRHSVLEPRRLRAVLSEQRISVLWLSVGLFNQMARVVPDAFVRLRYLIVGGDALDARTIAQVLEAAPPQHLLNGYGPTETTTFATTYEIRELAADAASVPIGRPIANTRIYILDDHGQPVPVGAAGEIHIGGAGVARGYLNRPEMTAERFVTDPFSTGCEARMYRTGDVGRYLPDGNIEFLGRNDAQVKIRGYRIELAEIEARLCAQPGVREAVVLAASAHPEPGEKRLVAYVVGESVPLDVVQLREQLSKELPEYMVPAAYVQLEAMPLTPNGKLDRRALPAPEGSAFAQRAYEAPQGELEQALAEIWSGLLGVERVGRHDHFLKLGGHSLLAVQLMSRVQEQLGLEVSLQELFAHPVLSEFAHVVSQARRSGLAPLQALDRPEQLPLSYAQQRLWFIVQLDEQAGAAYHMPAALRLRGHLDADALKRALDRIVCRHEVLRTNFELVAGQPVQRIAPADAGIQWQRQNLTDVQDEQRQAEQVRYWSELEARAPFDLAHGALIRARLLHLAEQDHVLLLTMHHIVSDGWSIGVLVRELSALYRAFSQGQADPLTPLKIQYADYALWQRQHLHERLQQQLTYWKQELQGAPELVDLTTDRARPAVQDYAGECVEVELDAQLTEQLRALSQRHGTTLHMMLLSAWAGLVGRLSGQQEVVIGTPVANRTEAQIEELIGFFVNTLALRVDLRGSPNVAELLGRVRRCTVQGLSHQDVPFEQVVEALKPNRALSHHPIFQLMFVWQNAPQKVLELDELSLEWLPGKYRRAKFDMTLELREQGERITGELEYASALYERGTIQRHVQYFQAMLRGMVADERHAVEQLPLLSEVERYRVLVEWNQAPRSYRRDRCIHELFEAQVSRTPDAPALVYEDLQLSYAQLNDRANRLARYLRSLGVRPDVRVAILAERSLEMVVGLLAVLKASGAYVPLDPAYPVERLSYMLRDSGAAVLLVYADLPPEASLQLRQSLSSGVPVLDMRADAHRWSRRSGRNIARDQSATRANQLAYVIYTSGSTGKPKGVMVEHANVARLFSATQEWFGFNREDVWTLFHSFAFDFSVWEIWGALLHGGRLVVVPQLTSRSPQDFYELVCAEGVTVLNQTPSAFRQLIAAQARNGRAHQLRYVIFGGEALEISMLAPWYERAINSAVQLINMYGITETTVHVTYHQLQQGELAQAGASPIGRRIPDLRVYVLDQHGQPVPPGVAGEIYVGGAGVARGYLNRHELTAARFVKDPFSAERDARMYRTGDLGRYLPDGNLEYLGRNDQQVKIRGFRIELGEIEAQLCAQSGVLEAVVLASVHSTPGATGSAAREDASREKRLVAYIVSDGAEVDIAQLRQALAQKLPEYMLPAAYVQLDHLPLTPNGKLDRDALPVPDQSSFAQRPYEAPQGELEQVLAQIWSELLGVERIGRSDQFFQLGGHSLLAVQLMERMRRAGLHTAIRTLFTQPTLAGFAQAVRETQQSGWREVEVPPNVITTECDRITPSMLPLIDLTQAQIDEIVSRVPGGVTNIQDIYPLAPLQEGILFHHLLQQEGDPYLVMSMLAFDSQGRLQRFVQALQSVIDRHDILRTAVLWEGLPEPVQVVWRQAPLAVEQIEVQGVEDVAAHLHACFDPRRHRLDVRVAPLLRVITARDERNGRWLLLCLLHHLVDDNTSMKQLSREVRAHMLDQVGELPAPVAFRNFVSQARLGVSKQEHEAFFRRMLADVQEPTAPYGLLQVHGDGADVVEQHLLLERSLSQRIGMQARALGVSTASIFHFVWGLVLSRLSGQDDVVFGTVLFGRMQSGVGADRALGLFINTLPIRVRLGETAVAKGISKTHESLAQLVTHEHASLTLAQRCSDLPAQVPLFSALLNYRHGSSESAAAGEWVEGIEVLATQERSNYPCALSVDDLGGDFALTAQVVAPLSAQSICRYMQQGLNSVMQALEQAPETPAWRIGLLDEAERHQLLVQWNQTQREYLRDHCIHELFEAQAARTPDAIALVYQEQQLSYEQLNTRANKLARYLRTLGVGPEIRVAILAERSSAMLVSVLAILKAGGAYVPLDPTHPVERLCYMLRDSDAAVLLVHEEHGGTSFEQLLQAGVPVVDTRADAAQWARASGKNISRSSSEVQPHHLAYVIYTSGSTGEPKGVAIEHRNVVNFWQAVRELYRQQIEVPRIGLNAPLTFDASVQQWVQLLSGCTLLILPQTLRRDPQALLSFMECNGIDGVDCTPSQLKSWISAGLLDLERSKLQTVLVGGEAIDTALWDQLARSRAVKFHNVYGPTECTVDTTAAHLADCPDIPTIGRPLPNARVYILDARRQPVPLGVTGELYIGGAGVARGYLNRPALTAQRFVKDPFSAEPDARMYRTGDLGRHLPDGNIEYLGRNDEQVKIRGFRIELGEIEARLAAQPGVHEAVVLAAPAGPRTEQRDDVSGEKRLVAYVVGESRPLNVAQLREQLSRELPEYMVPAAYVQLDALPLSPNGKLDRRVLPAPDDEAFAQHAYEAPQGELEETLARIWSDLLGLERIGRDDHFFELGGHSLLAVQLMERMRQRGMYADIRALFTQPSLRRFAQAVREAQQAGRREVIVPPNVLEKGCERITPAMLPLIDLTQAQIDQIVSCIPAGVANIQDIYPLAPLQEGILFHHLLQQDGDPYLVVSTLSFASLTRLQGFVQALQMVIDRHDILRTAVLWEGLPEPVQVVCREARMEVQMLALQDVSVREALEKHSDPAHFRLDIRQAPLLKCFAAFDEHADRWLLRVVWHHLISDHSALETLVQEVRLIESGQQHLLSAPMPFRNFVAQARLAASQEEHEAFFRQMLADVEEPTAPYGLLQVHGDGTAILEEKVVLESLLSRRIRHRARALGVSAASLFHFAWAQVLSQLSGRDDVVFGTVLLGRIQGGAGADRALGLFMNTLPLRICLGETPVVDGIRHTHASLAQLMRHEHASLALAQRCSGVAAQVPLFSALLNYRHSQASAAAASTADIDVLSSQERTNYPCVLSVDDLGSDFTLTVQVAQPLSAQRVCRYVQQGLSELVEALERSPLHPAWRMGVIDDTERRQLLVEWNRTQKSYPDRCVHELFEEQVVRTPDAIAVLYADQSLTYAELNARSNQLARYLRDRGVGPNQLVAICVERSLELIVGLLGIWKAGGAYLPLDPTHPPQRLAYMLQDAGASMLLTQERLQASLPATTAAVIALDDWNAIAVHDRTNLPPRSSQSAARNLAYLIYTSGSTGTPKGVLVEHAGVANCLTAMLEHLDVTNTDCMLAVTTISFDIAGVEIYLPLLKGAKVVLVGRDAAADPQQLMATVEERDVTLMQATPTTWQMLLAAGWAGRSNLTALCGGEALQADLSRHLASRVGALWNLYGPTETSIWSNIRRITAAPERDGVECIGHAIANTRVYILDSRMQLAPIGVTGEIYIAGAGVARGYLNQPELTMQRFVADPFGDGVARMYKTGDLGRWRADGTIDFVGRNDHQVKIRGFRIELGEIEAQIARYAQVQRVLVVAREEVPGEKRLVAYITLHEPESLSIPELRAHLTSVLPEYMVPSAFVELERFPLTPNGKLDRRALPAPDGQAYATREYEPPAGSVETAVAQIWTELLGVERIGRQDNFFELGGHSLTDLKLVARIAQQFDVQIHVQAVYQCPTVQQLAQLIEERLPRTRMSSASGELELEEYVL